MTSIKLKFALNIKLRFVFLSAVTLLSEKKEYSPWVGSGRAGPGLLTNLQHRTATSP